MSVHLSYDFQPGTAPLSPQAGGLLENPVFRILAAVREEGSIGRAAARLGLSYRHVWGYLKQQEAALGRELLMCAPGQPALLSEFGERLMWAEKRALARLLPSAETLAAKLDRELLLAVHPELHPMAVCASHDLLFGALRDRVRSHAEVLLDIDYLGSAGALEALNRDACILAGIHIPLDSPQLCRRGGEVHRHIGSQLRLGDHKLVRLARREQGLMVQPGNPLGIADLEALVRTGVSFVNRRPGSGTRILLDELLDFHRIPRSAVSGYGEEEASHLSVAATVAAGLADCGFGLRAAAMHFGLEFVPVVTEQYFVVCRKPALESDGVRAVVEVLRSEAFRGLAEALPGYSAEGAGQIISLRRSLPWYK